MTPLGRTWRIIGALLTLLLFVVAFSNRSLLVMALVGLGGVAIFLVSWLVADVFDVKATR